MPVPTPPKTPMGPASTSKKNTPRGITRTIGQQFPELGIYSSMGSTK